MGLANDEHVGIFQLRNHPPPRQEQFDNLLKCAATRGFHVDTSSNKALAASLDACMDSKDPLVNSVGADTQVDSPVDDTSPSCDIASAGQLGRC